MNMQSSNPRKPFFRAAVPLMALGYLASAPVIAQDAPVMIDASACLKFETSVERLVCFEEQAKAAAGNTGSSQGNLPVLRIERSNAQPAAPTAPPAAPRSQAGTSAPVQAPAAPAPAAVAESQPATPAADPVASFGLPQERESESEVRGRELHATIESFREISPNQYMITLTNGQVWRQMRPDFYNIREGHDVRIYPTRWGSAYRLTVEELKGFIQVERVR